MKDFIKYVLIILLLMFLIAFAMFKVKKIGTHGFAECYINNPEIEYCNHLNLPS